MNIGCTKELKNNENRVGLTPDNVKDYIEHGHNVYIEKNAGFNAGFTDKDYINAGAIILNTPKEVFDKSDMIVKVKEPEESEYNLFKEGQILYCYLHLAANPKLTKFLVEKGVNAVGFETIKDSSGGLPCLKPMSIIAGGLAVTEGIKYLNDSSRKNILILGSGTVGISALKQALDCGLHITILDRNILKIDYLNKTFPGMVNTLLLNECNVKSSLKDADIVVGAILVPGGETPKLVTKEDLSIMKKDSVIVDVSIDQGGCFETSKPTTYKDPVYKVDNITHYCVGNMPGAVPQRSTVALANATIKYGLLIADNGLEKAMEKDKYFACGVNILNHKCINELLNN